MKNKLIRFTMAVAALFAAQTVVAQSFTDNMYVSASGSFGLNSKNKSSTTSTKFKRGMGAGLAVGYKLDQWRFELEGSFRRNKVKTTANNVAGVTTNLTGGSLKRYSVMANALYDFEIAEQLEAYVGAGLGWTNSKLAFNNVAGAAHVKSRSNDFGAQVMAGVTYKMTEQWSVFAGYRFFTTVNKPKYKAAVAAGKTKFKRTYAHMIEAGVRFQF